jgi:hypothetical protein
MYARMSTVFGVACFALAAAAMPAQAQGTVAWSAGYPVGVNTVGPPMAVLGKIKVKGTHTPTAGWFFHAAQVNS